MKHSEGITTKRIFIGLKENFSLEQVNILYKYINYISTSAGVVDEFLESPKASKGSVFSVFGLASTELKGSAANPS